MAMGFSATSQKVIELPFSPSDDVTYEGEERQYFSEVWQTTVVSNVFEPTLTVYEPSSEKKNGASVIIAPGGGLYALSINSEGIDVANWLVSKGYTAFVLKYRLVPTKDDATQEIMDDSQNEAAELVRKVTPVLPTSIADGLASVSHVRSNAETYGIDPDKIGFMGFSAGGAVTLGVAYNYDESTKPNFLVPVYPWTTVIPLTDPKEDAPPMLIICASDDALGLASGSIELYNKWYQKQLNVGLHMYSKGDHGFGMKTQGFASDSWIERFHEWALTEKVID